MFASAGLKSAHAHGESDRPRLWLEASVWWSRALPDTATLNPRFKLLMLIAACRTERRKGRLVARDVGSGRSIEAA
jgi:hypothetical protein